MSSYSRLGYFALKEESAENTAVKPDVFVPLMSEDIVTEWGAVAATPVAGNRALNLRPVETAIAPPSGTVNILIEPKTIGYFLKGVYGALSSGQLIKINTLSADFTVGETVTGGTSSVTATVVATSSEGDYVLVSSASGDFTDGETITGGTSSSTAVVVDFATTRYGHQFVAPQSSLPTFTVEIGLGDEAYRYTGVRFNALGSIAQSDNIITAALNMTARAEFKHARVTAVESSGAGAHTIDVDQTTGLAASDTIKVYRPGTGYLDFSASSVKTHTINAVTSETTFTITNLETALAVGDLIVIAPQTPSYSVDSEFSWIGGSIATVANTITSAVSASGDCIEDFELVVTNEIEGRHCANGTNVINRFPGKNLLKGLTGSGSLTRTYTDPTYLDRMRNSTPTAIYVKHEGGQIGSTGLKFELGWRTPLAIFQAFNPSISEDDLLNQEMPFDMYDSEDDGYFHKAVLVNDVSSY